MDDIPKEKILKDLNLTGIFLERTVYDFLENSIKPQVEQDYVAEIRSEFPYSKQSVSLEGTIDILFVFNIGWYIIVIAIECKRANPKQKIWLFERSKDKYTLYPFDYFDNQSNSLDYTTARKINLPKVNYVFQRQTRKAFEQGFEFNQSTGNINRTQSEKIFSALRQANNAISCYLFNRTPIISLLPDAFRNDSKFLFIPLVVTTAKLRSIEYSSKDIDSDEGKIGIDKLNLLDQASVLYDFPLSYRDSLQSQNHQIKRPTFVVGINYFEQFMNDFLSDIQSTL